MGKFTLFTLVLLLGCVRLFAEAGGAVFKIGKPDGGAGEFKFFRNLGDVVYSQALPQRDFRDVDGCAAFFKKPPTFVVGKSKDCDWSFVHPVLNCRWAGTPNPARLCVQFEKPESNDKFFYLKIGFSDMSANAPCGLEIFLNGESIAKTKRLFDRATAGTFINHKDAKGTPSLPFVVKIPAEKFREGANRLEFAGVAGKHASKTYASWLVYDFIELSASPKYPEIPDARAGLVERAAKAAGSDWVVFCITGSSRGGHWYENVGTLCRDDTAGEIIKNREGAESFSRMGGRLVLFNLKTREYKVLLEDPKGGIRDPHVSYDAKKIIFSYRKGDSDKFNLYEIDADGKKLARLPINTNSNDIEPCYLPDGDVMYVSDRMVRTVQCWMSPSLNLHRFYRKRSIVRCLSGNPDVDNTPSVLSDGRVLYMRWDYNHRNQVRFHHLWAVNPDGSGNAVFYGNTFPHGVFLSAKQFPDSQNIVMTLSPGHGARDHRGIPAILKPPFDPSSPHAYELLAAPERLLSFYDVSPLVGGYVLTNSRSEIYVFDKFGLFETVPVPAVLFSTTEKSYTNNISYGGNRRGGECTMIMRSVVPLAKRQKPAVALETADYRAKTARVFLQDVYTGRNMKGVKRGSIKKLMITRVQPAPVNYHGGYAPTGIAGSFALEEIVGTVPVYEDGSAFFEIPAGVGVAFTALDADGRCVKRMMSSTNFAPATQTSCIGCHENRTDAPERKVKLPIAYKNGVSKIEKIDGVKNTVDFMRDIQPLLDKYCVQCHNPRKPSGGGVILSKGVGVEHISARLALQAAGMMSCDNNAHGNLPPYKFGSGDARLAEFARGGHHNKKFSDTDLKVLQAYLDIGAPQISTYASKGTGFPIANRLRTRFCVVGKIPEMPPSCAKCHAGTASGMNFVFDGCRVMGVRENGKVRRLKTPLSILCNFIDPQNSPMLLVPLAKEAGGSAGGAGAHPIIFKDKNDPVYAKLSAEISRCAAELDRQNPFITSKNFRPSFGYVVQMQRCGILPPNWNAKTPVNPYAIDNAYFRWIEKNISVDASTGKPISAR